MASISYKEFLKKASATPQDVQVSVAKPEPIQESPGFVSRVVGDIQKRGEGVVEEITKPDQAPVVSGFKAVKELFGGIGDVAGEVATAIAPKTTEKIGEVVGKGFSKIIDYSTPIGEKLLQLEEKHPDVAKAIENFLEVASASGDISGNILLAEGLRAGGAKIDTGIKDLVSKIPTEKIGGVLKTAGEKTTGIAVSMEEPTAIAMQTYQSTQPTLWQRIRGITTGKESQGIKPITEANTVTRLLPPGTEWRLGVHANRVAGELWEKTIAPALESGGKVNMKEFFGVLEKRIIRETSDLTRRNTLLNALESIKEDFIKVNEVSLLKLQAYKEGWAKFVPEKAYRGQPIAGALNEVRNMSAQNARAIIYDKLGEEIKQAYLDYGNLKSIMESGIKSIDPLRSRSIFKQAWEAFVDKAVTPVATTAGKTLYKTGEGLELIGKEGAKKVGDIILKQ